MDVAALGTINQAAAFDLHELIDVKRGQASRCADPVRALVRQREPGFGRVGVVVRAIGVRGRSLVIQSVSVAPKFPGAFDECVEAALRGTAPTIASGDYALDVRLYLCVDPEPLRARPEAGTS